MDQARTSSRTLRITSPYHMLSPSRISALPPAGLISVVLAAGLLAGCMEVESKPGQAVPVRVMPVVMEPITPARRYTGIIRPRHESDLAFRVGGKVVERLINVGERVAPGTLIARLDPTDFRLSLEAQEAELAAAMSSRDEAVASEERFRILLAKGHVAVAALDSRRAAADEARARVRRAERTLESLRNQVQYTELRADRDGVVSTLPVEAGQVVAAGQTVARIARLDELEAAVAIPEQLLDTLDVALASVELWPATGKTYAAKLREVSPDADPASRTFDVRFSIANPDPDVRLGKTASVSLRLQEERLAARLPLSAVMNDAKGPMVWVVDATGQRLERRAIAIEAFGQDSVTIASGLSPGEKVVTLGVHTLDAATQVRVVETKAIAGTASATNAQ